MLLVYQPREAGLRRQRLLSQPPLGKAVIHNPLLRGAFMVAIHPQWQEYHEEKIARLTEAAYNEILARGYRGSFIDLELSLWASIRQAVEQDDRVDLLTVDAA